MSGKTRSSPSSTTPSLRTGPAAVRRPGAAAAGTCAMFARTTPSATQRTSGGRAVSASWAPSDKATPAPASARPGAAGSFVRLKERVAVVRRRHERLLDRARAHPADQVPDRARLVVRARRARAAEGLLADDGARRLVVDVEVASRVAEGLVRLVDRVAVVREDGAGERVGARRVDELERVLPTSTRRRRTPSRPARRARRGAAGSPGRRS